VEEESRELTQGAVGARATKKEAGTVAPVMQPSTVVPPGCR